MFDQNYALVCTSICLCSFLINVPAASRDTARVIHYVPGQLAHENTQSTKDIARALEWLIKSDEEEADWIVQVQNTVL